MSIDVRCICGQRFKAEEDQAGQRVPCSGCWRTVTIPDKIAMDAPLDVLPADPVLLASTKPAEAPPAPSSDLVLIVKCLCGAVNEAPAAMAGQRAACTGCWRSVVFPVPEKPTDEQPATTVPRKRQTIAAPCVCGKLLRVPSDLIGQTVQCPLCRRMVVVPDPAVRPALPEAMAAQPPARPSPRDYLYWALLPALLPLVLILLAPEPRPFKDRLEQALKTHSEVRQQLHQRYFKRLPTDPSLEEFLAVVPLDDVIKALPDAKLDGDAFLPRTTRRHWLYAGAAALAFFCLGVVVFVRKGSQAWSMLLVGVFTGTLGVALLLGVQQIFGISAILDETLLHPDADLGYRLLGFIFGVGLFEELFKALPLFWYVRYRGKLDWRTACMWGMASGAGFGISEGIMYSAVFYNGVESADAYVLRFASCVTLHAVWTASVGISLARARSAIRGGLDTVIEGGIPFWEWIWPVISVLAVAMTLHGLYDGLLSASHLQVWALLIALLSFAWLGWQIETCREEDQRILAALEAPQPAPAD
jgi:RsiW-degrading membrane proteinase PrsW (M82 family)